MMALASGAAGQTVTTPGARVTLDVIGDTGAGEHLGSRQAFVEQGVEDSMIDMFSVTSSKSMSFDTGGGKKQADETVGLWSKA